MFLLGDQPMLKSAVIDQVLGAFWLSEKDIGVPVWRTKRGNPAIFSRAMYAQLMAIEGDVGARNIIRANPEQVLGVEVDDPLCFMDIDSPQDYEYLQRLLAVPPEPIAKVQT